MQRSGRSRHTVGYPGPRTRANTQRFLREMFESSHHVDVGHGVRGIGGCYLGQVGY